MGTPGGSEPRDSAGKAYEAEAGATDGPPETELLPRRWQIKPDTWPPCVTALAICRSTQQTNGPRFEGEKNWKKLKLELPFIHTVERADLTLHSACPVQLEMGEAEGKEGSHRAWELGVRRGAGTPRFSHLMLKEALALRASSPVASSRATHWKAPASCSRSTAAKLRLLPWAKRRSVSWTGAPSSSQDTWTGPEASTSQRSRARRP